MISREKNPDYLNGFLDYMVTIQNKSPNIAPQKACSETLLAVRIISRAATELAGTLTRAL